MAAIGTGSSGKLGQDSRTPAQIAWGNTVDNAKEAGLMLVLSGVAGLAMGVGVLAALLVVSLVL